MIDNWPEFYDTEIYWVSTGNLFLYVFGIATVIAGLIFAPGYFIAAFLVACFILTQPEDRKPSWVRSINTRFQRIDCTLGDYLLEKLARPAHQRSFHSQVPSPRKEICPYCRAAFSDETRFVSCKECETLHHQDCWIRNDNKCSIFGCEGNQFHKTAQ